MDSDFKTALVQATKTYDADLLRPALVRRTMYTFALAEDPATFVALVNGAIPNAIAWNNTIFWLDETDATTPGDGATVIRTFDDYCYKVEDIDMRVRSALSASTTTPPVSPSVGDSYVVPAGATGAWSSHQDDITTYTPRGWVFEVPGLGRQIQVEDTNGMLRYSATGWVYGYGAQAFSAASIPFSAALGWGARFEVENQSTTTPPTATKGLRYIVGASATGAWLGKDKQIAICEVAGTWTFYPASIGWSAYDKALSAPYTWSGTAWVSGAGAWVSFADSGLKTTGGSSTAGSGAYTYSATTAPTSTLAHTLDTTAQVTIAADYVGQKLRITYSASAMQTPSLYRDLETTAIDWGAGTSSASMVVFVIAAADTNSHTYKIRLPDIGGGLQTIGTRRRMTIEKAA